ncbi:ATP-binding protein [uncultured Fibrobacter sp.]|uniref:ATP-binding protein n=1 Tax=uncultured Fibrobacter sp. TaxID=261512 RepID=UPI002636F06E|nr:ATP-binding protein [uncultured Fibrobacter sp.]
MNGKISRIIAEDVSRKFFKGKVIVVYGPRQSGKTTLIKELLREMAVSPVFLNGDDDLDVHYFDTVTASRWTQLMGEKKVVFIDEGQKIQNLGRAVKLLVDSRDDVQVVITGSSSFTLANSVEEPLTGRKFEYRLFPLSYAELAKHFGFLEESKKLELRLIYGSYPEVVTNEDGVKETLKMLADSYLYRDLMQYEGIRKPAVLEKLLRAVALQVGSEVSYNELAGLIGVSRTLVESYLKILEQAFIIFPLTSYSNNLRNEIKKGVKYYFWDNGIRNAVLNDFTPVPQRNDIGALWENYAISERMKRNAYGRADGLPYFWRTTDQIEVDYLEVCGSKIKAFEFKWNPKKKSRVTKAFTNRYPDAEVETITPENFGEWVGNGIF